MIILQENLKKRDEFLTVLARAAKKVKAVFHLMFLAFGFVLVSCAEAGDRPSKDFIVQTSVTATYGGRPVEASSVIYQKMIYASPYFTRGQATIIELGNGKRAYHVLLDPGLSNVYYHANTLAFSTYINSVDCRKPNPDDWLERVLATPAGTKVKWDYRKYSADRRKCNQRAPRFAYPLVVAFQDENDPTSVFQVETEKPTMLFGKRFVFGEWSMERLPKGTPLTTGIEEYLPWADAAHPYWRGKNFMTLEQPDPRAKAPVPLATRLVRIAFLGK